jgi:exodeoxyribonuclease VII large subunit
MPALLDNKTYTVSQLNREVRQLLGDHFFAIRIEGEISNLSQPASGHLYFSLKDDRAQIRCALFRHKQRHLGFKPENGQHVIATAQVSLYEPRGDYQLIVEQLEEAGSGALQRAFEQLKQKLSAEGLFDTNRKQALPTLPHCIGVITSASGAAIKDILTVLKRRFPAIPVIIYPTAVQGDNAQQEIVRAIQQANQQALADVLILGRGGGSLEDLWSFNEEMVARAIADSTIPIISAVGHETDFTIADFVADLRAPTPSAAAEHAVPNQMEWLNTFRAYEIKLQQLIERKLQQCAQSLDWLYRALQQQHPGQKLARNHEKLIVLEKRLLNHWRQQQRQRHSVLFGLSHRLLQQNPANSIVPQRQTLDKTFQRLQHAMSHQLQQKQQRYQAATQTLQAVSPLATLERGYAIVQKVSDDAIIKSSHQLQAGDKVKTRLGQGQFISHIEKIEL